MGGYKNLSIFVYIWVDFFNITSFGRTAIFFGHLLIINYYKQTAKEVMNLISNLKLQRVIRDKTQYEVADAIGIKQSYLSLLENKQAVLTPELLKKLSEYYKVEQKELI